MKQKQFTNGNRIADHGLTREAVDVYICLSRQLQKKNGTYPGDKIIAAECGISAQDVPKYLQQLIQAGFIT